MIIVIGLIVILVIMYFMMQRSQPAEESRIVRNAEVPVRIEGRRGEMLVEVGELDDFIQDLSLLRRDDENPHDTIRIQGHRGEMLVEVGEIDSMLEELRSVRSSWS